MFTILFQAFAIIMPARQRVLRGFLRDSLRGSLREGFGALFLVFFLGLAPVHAQEEAVNAHPALWKVEKAEGSLYLFGSFHILPAHVKWYGGALKTAFEASDTLVLETVMTPDAMAQVQGIFAKRSFLPEGKSLHTLLDIEHFALATEIGKGFGLSEEQVNRMQPWALSLNFAIMSMMKHGYDVNAGVDQLLQGKAGNMGKKLLGLESPVDGLNALTNHPLPLQATMLADTLEKLADFDTYTKKFLNAWTSGDTNALNEVMVKDMEKYVEVYEALLVKRNRAWLPAIEEMTAQGNNTFITVGAAHLVGPDGVVKMLRDKGYKVEKVQ